MIFEERDLPLNEVGKVFKIIAKELRNNHTQIIISNDILKELKSNHCAYHVYFHNYPDDLGVSEWYTLHEEHTFSPVISKLGVRPFGYNCSQVLRFYFRNYNFSAQSHRHNEFGEFIYFEHQIQRILMINLV